MNTSSSRPIDYAKKFYGPRFDSMVAEFFEPNRYVYSGDDIFVLAYPYSIDMLFEQSINKTLDKFDVWVIHYFAGNIKRIFAIAPFDLPFVAFERRGEWKTYRMDELKRRLYHGISTVTEESNKNIIAGTDISCTCTDRNICGCTAGSNR
jgi:hypothetical protein